MQKHKIGSCRGGFTLIELMLVVIIIGALTAMVMPRLAGRTEQAKVSAAKADISANIATALKLYELDNGRYPSSEDGGLQALFNKPSNASNWNGPYLEKDPVDPWGRKYQYQFPGTHGKTYDLYSFGAKEKDEKNWVTNWEKPKEPDKKEKK